MDDLFNNVDLSHMAMQQYKWHAEPPAVFIHHSPNPDESAHDNVQATDDLNACI